MSKKDKSCCAGSVVNKSNEPPDHSAELNRLNRIKGQIDGIARMIEDRRYCPDIITQTSAVRAAIASLEGKILEKHLNACVRSAFKAGGSNSEEKIQELLEIFKKRAK